MSHQADEADAMNRHGRYICYGRYICGIAGIAAIVVAAGCSGDDGRAAWDIEDDFPQIIPGACDEVLAAHEGRPDIERLDEDTWALNFEPFVEECAVYHLSLELSPDPDALLQKGGTYRIKSTVCNRCNADQALNFVSHTTLADDPPEEILVSADPEGFPWLLGGAGTQIVFGEAPGIDFIAGCDRIGGETTQMIVPGPYLLALKLSRFPLKTNEVFLTGASGSINALVGAVSGPAKVEVGSQLDLRIFWPRMVPVDAPLDPETAAFSTPLCTAHGWEYHGPGQIALPEDFDYDWAGAYWHSPTKYFELPPELLERFPR